MMRDISGRGTPVGKGIVSTRHLVLLKENATKSRDLLENYTKRVDMCLTRTVKQTKQKSICYRSQIKFGQTREIWESKTQSQNGRKPARVQKPDQHASWVPGRAQHAQHDQHVQHDQHDQHAQHVSWVFPLPQTNHNPVHDEGGRFHIAELEKSESYQIFKSFTSFIVPINQ